jgi:hypothetical protein
MIKFKENNENNYDKLRFAIIRTQKDIVNRACEHKLTIDNFLIIKNKIISYYDEESHDNDNDLTDSIDLYIFDEFDKDNKVYEKYHKDNIREKSNNEPYELFTVIENDFELWLKIHNYVLNDYDLKSYFKKKGCKFGKGGKISLVKLNDYK